MVARTTNKRKSVRYAVVGLGHIAQVAVLPAFKHATKNSELAAIVSDDAQKRAEIGEMYGLQRTYTYAQYDDCLASGEIDAVYIALPNTMHREFTERAAQAGVHVLCEKPLAVTEEECQSMIAACADNSVKLMVAYRLHFEPANLRAIEIVKSGVIGEPKYFNSSFSLPVVEGNIRVEREMGGGTMYDIGVYCINAARYLFRSNPLEVTAISANSGEARFEGVDETTGVVMRFPGERIAAFVCSFSGADMSSYQIVGTKGVLRLEPAYDYATKLKHYLTIDGKTKSKSFSQKDQFAPELIYFSRCILRNKDPEPSGEEGLIDVHIVRKVYESAKSGKTIKLDDLPADKPPDTSQEIRRPAVRKPELVNVTSPSGE
jgi:glucose-fructose oxidoreductase